ncbi:MAG: hypothetical protein RBU45_03520 [Myxococcota bacterium]|jgi:hypothetical protein|nr:hypothetical protein [Myxococcota bacterium]
MPEAPRPSIPTSLDAVPARPRRPSPRARRLIFAYTGGQQVFRWIGGVFLLLGLPATLLFAHGLPTDLLLLLDGEPVTGTVIAREDFGYVVNGAIPVRIRYRYAAGGQEREASQALVDHRLSSRLEPGSTVALEVSRQLPGCSRLAGQQVSVFGWLGAAALAFPLVGSVLLAAAIRTNRREIRAFVRGRATWGKVTQAGPDFSVRVNGRHPYRVEWEFRLGDRSFSGSLSSMDPRELEEFATAARVVVLYDPAQPAANTLWVS